MRVLGTSAGASLGVTPSQEAAWPDLSAAAIEAAWKPWGLLQLTRHIGDYANAGRHADARLRDRLS